jgi:hypothetical protein
MHMAGGEGGSGCGHRGGAAACRLRVTCCSQLHTHPALSLSPPPPPPPPTPLLLPGLELRSGELLAADLVVVAGGRHALLPQARAAHMRTGLCSFPLPPLAHARMRHYRPPSCPHIALASSRDACSQPSQCRHYAQWLAAAGHPVPPTLKVDAQLAYVGRMYKIPAGWDGQQVGRGCQH